MRHIRASRLFINSDDTCTCVDLSAAFWDAAMDSDGIIRAFYAF